jgi:hypothetical protein
VLTEIKVRGKFGECLPPTQKHLKVIFFLFQSSDVAFFFDALHGDRPLVLTIPSFLNF